MTSNGAVWTSAMRMALAGFFVLSWTAATSVWASPPACMRDISDIFRSADVVVLAAPVEGKRISYEDRIGLVSKFRVIEQLKGRVKEGATIQLEDHCINRPVPRGMEGYPAAQQYCLGGYRPRLPGIDNATGQPLHISSDGLVLFLNAPGKSHAGSTVYKVVSQTGYGGSCSGQRRVLTAEERAAMERIRSLQKDRRNLFGIDGQ